jgi:hypothetical protein
LQKLNFSLKILVIMWPLPPTFMYAYHSTTWHSLTPKPK